MSAVTGERISVIHDAIRHVSGRWETANGCAYPVTGVSHDDLVNAMQLLNWEVIASEIENNRRDIFRLGDFLDEYGDDGPFIVEVTGHYYAASHGEICDTALRLPTKITLFKRGRARWVWRWWKFSPGVIGTFTEEGFGGVSVDAWVKSWRERKAARRRLDFRPESEGPFGVPDQEAV
jgi:hypothetical protein